MQAPGPSPLYQVRSYGRVVLFDFFLPVSRERSLREGLDGLFERKAVEARLRGISAATRARFFGEAGDEESGEVLARAADWVARAFRGYSLSYVKGRFRGALEARASGPDEVVDETTAVVRFVFPVGEPAENPRPPGEEYLEKLLASSDDDALRAEADRVRWAFYALFVEPVVGLCEGEEEIWLLESGYASRLHQWVRESPSPAR